MPRFIDASPYPWPHDGALRPQTTALLIIDMQRDFCATGGYIASMGYDVGPARAILQPLARISALARGWGAKIIYTRESHRPDFSDRRRKNPGGPGRAVRASAPWGQWGGFWCGGNMAMTLCPNWRRWPATS